jgi:hypothetical protein
MSVDNQAWTDAHDYHRYQQLSHSLWVHGAGIVGGLEITATGLEDNSIMVHPGMAIDENGTGIVVREPQLIPITSHRSETIYIIVQSREIEESDPNHAGHGLAIEPTYILEVYRGLATNSLPNEAYLELARIHLSGSGNPLTAAADRRAPNQDEIDLRYRRYVTSRSLGNARVGIATIETDLDGHPVHTRGLIDLLDGINGSTNYSVDFYGYINITDIPEQLTLLMMAGYSSFDITEDMTRSLETFLSRGGVIFGESCVKTSDDTQDSGGFQASFNDLAVLLDRQLVSVENGHPVLGSLHKFSSPPAGVRGTDMMVSGDGMFFNDCDYGCLWEVGVSGDNGSRELIRSTVELGVNVVVYSHQRALDNRLTSERTQL